MIERRDILGQEIKVGSYVARCKNLWKGRDEMAVAEVAKLTKARVTLAEGGWTIPEKVLELNVETNGLVAERMTNEAEERRLEEDNQ